MCTEPRSERDEPDRGIGPAEPGPSLEHVLDEAVKEIIWGVDRVLSVGDDTAMSWDPDGLAQMLYRPETRPIARDILKLAGILARRQIAEIAAPAYLAEALELASRFEASAHAGLAEREVAAAEFAREFEGRLSL
jgi:hypothetical protein